MAIEIDRPDIRGTRAMRRDRRRRVGLLLAVGLTAAASARPAGSNVDERGPGQPPTPTLSSVRQAKVAESDPLERALAADRARVRSFGGPAARVSSLPSKPEGIDLDALYIQMTPLYLGYCVEYSSAGLPHLCSGTGYDKHWPDRGEVVTFTAHFMNKGTVASGALQYAWSIDGIEVARGEFPNLEPGTGSVAAYAWPWDHDVVNGRLLGRHTVRFTLDPDNRIAETYKSNNTIEDRTDATPLGFQMTPEVYQALETPVDPTLPFSAEDWAQRQFRAMNDAFARSVFPSAPTGCEERVRLNQIQVAEEQVANDGGIGGWFLASDDRIGGSGSPERDIDTPMLHELAHQLGVIDVYHFDYGVDQPHRAKDLRGRPVLLEQSTAYLPGLMSAESPDPPQFDEHTTGGMNANKGYRRGYFGEYQFDLPAVTRVRVLDATGAPAAGTTIRLFRVPRWAGDPLADSGAPGIEVETDADGIAVLPNRPAGGPLTTATGHVLRDNPFGPIDVGEKNLFLMEIRKGTHQEFAWLANTDLNLLAWSGSDLYEVASHVPPSGAPSAPASLTGTSDSGVLSLQWGASSSPGVVGYRLYRTVGPRDTWVREGDPIVETSCEAAMDATVAGYAVTSVDATGRESGFSETFWKIPLDTPSGVTIGAGNLRYARLYEAILPQDATGRSLDWLPVGGYDLGHVSCDASGRVVMTRERGDSVAVVNPLAQSPLNIVMEIGGTGSGPGQFHAPAGVVAWGDACNWGGPFTADAHTLLLCHFDGTLHGENGAQAKAAGVYFTAGRFGQGVYIDRWSTLSYAMPPGLTSTQGTIEFWVQPTRGGDQAQGYVLFETGTEQDNGMTLQADGPGRLRFLAWADGEETGVAYGQPAWNKNEWHHVAVAWQGSTVVIYLDGGPVARSDSCKLPRALGPRILVGSNVSGAQQGNVVFDELRVSDIPRLGDSDTCTYRIVVADSGNDRLQVFDSLGQVVGSYGTSGTGPGQFAGPHGLATDGHGRIAVVDSGNSRLQLFGFDGHAFTFIREIAANLLGADGVAMRGNRIVVADTDHNQIKVLSDLGEVIAVYAGPNDGVYWGPFNEPRDVAIDGNGRIVVVDTGNSRVVGVIHDEPRPVRKRLRPGS